MEQPPDLRQKKDALVSRRFLVRLMAGVMFILVAVTGLALLSLYRSKQQYDSRIAVQTQNLAQSLNLSLTGILDKASVAIFAVKKEMEQQARSGGVNPDRIHNYLADYKTRLPEVDGLRVADAQGFILYADHSSTLPRINLSHRDYFKELRDHPQGGVVIGKPVLGMLSKKWQVLVATRVDNPDGSFAGIAYAAISLDYLSSLFATLDLGRDGVINLRDRDLDVVVRYPELSGKPTVGSKVVSRELKALVGAGRSKGTYRTKGSVDSVERVISFQKLSGYPMYIAAGLSTEDNLAPWYQEVKGTLALCALLSGILTLSGLLRYRKYQQEKLSERRLSEYQEQLEETVQLRTGELELRNRQLADEIALRKQAEAELEKAAVIMQKISDVVLWISSDARILYANDAATKLHGYSGEELRRLTVLDLNPRFDAASWQTHWEDLKRDGTLTIETLNRSHSGREFPVEVTANYLCLNGAEYNCAIIRDITERREAEKEKQLLMQQLFQAQKIESVGRLAGGIAHDFNNLLTPILGYAELLKMDLPPEGNHYRRVDLITQAGDKAKVLIKQLLGFGRQQVLDMKTVDVNEVVRNFYEILRRTIRESIDIRLCLCQESLGVRADMNQLEQIVMNLAVNAQDAIGDKGSIRIETSRVVLDEEYARQHAEASPGEYLVLAVIDNGCGMSEETRSHIFEPFFTTKGVGKGTGLGLATIYGLVKQHDGHVWVESEPGRGTIFKVFLPVSGQVQAAESAAPKRRPLIRAREARLLLVEDSEVVRDMVADLMVSSGYRTLVAATPMQALRLAHQHHIDLLVSDVVMPDMSGPELYRELLKIRPEAKVLYMSGYTFDVVVEGRDLDEGIHFLQKPFAVHDLTEKIDTILGAD
ncbi:hypothetical protein GMST_36250 [Geomonas silvestris]|uniref:histidine kinase n=1 Tax=Geomonas silvestris TaxID=2740184 RepID=A0A6V8MMS9_9BACT|nr:hybrid sensor histidine kinase/response regulator [Geomonas silvestris]GFO61300.1 hypothetical protein GMST_36250 [Geomonas silvestris]